MERENLGEVPQSSAAHDLALKRYDSLLNYLQSENHLFWTRSQFFFAVHAGLLGLIFTRFPLTPDASVAQLVILAIAGIVGLVLAGLWFKAISMGQYWRERCHTLLKELEPHALDGPPTGESPENPKRLFIRDPKRPEQKATPQGWRAVTITRLTAWLFTGLWVVSLGYIGWTLATGYRP